MYSMLSARRMLMSVRQNVVTLNASMLQPRSPNSQRPLNADTVVKGKPSIETPRSEIAMLRSRRLLSVDLSFLFESKMTATKPLPVVDTIPVGTEKRV